MRNPIPLPPVVPNLGGDWSAGHYGFSSGLALDRDHLMVVLGQRQREMYDRDTPIEGERVETITIERLAGTSKTLGSPEAPAVVSGHHGEPEGEWRLAEHWTVEQWQEKTQQPLDDVGILKSGRRMRLTSDFGKPPPQLNLGR